MVFGGFSITPRKINMEPENTPLENENHLNQTIIIFGLKKLHYCSPTTSPVTMWKFTPRHRSFGQLGRHRVHRLRSLWSHSCWVWNPSSIWTSIHWTVAGSEIRRSPVELGSLDHYLWIFFTFQVVQDFFHQQYVIYINVYLHIMYRGTV